MVGGATKDTMVPVYERFPLLAVPTTASSAAPRQVAGRLQAGCRQVRPLAPATARLAMIPTYPYMAVRVPPCSARVFAFICSRREQRRHSKFNPNRRRRASHLSSSHLHNFTLPRVTFRLTSPHLHAFVSLDPRPARFSIQTSTQHPNLSPSLPPVFAVLPPRWVSHRVIQILSPGRYL
jgi:hypothetical protein